MKHFSRRDFLFFSSQNLAATYLSTSLISLLASSSAEAAQCPSASSLCPLITFCLPGGAGTSAQIVGMNKSKGLLDSYISLGQGKAQNIPIDYEFGSVPFLGSENGVALAKFIPQLRLVAGNLLQKTAFVSVMTRSRDDTGLNKMDISGLARSAGLVGATMGPLANNDFMNGIRGEPAVIKGPQPVAVTGPNQLKIISSLRGDWTTDQKRSLAKLTRSLSSAQMNRLLTDASDAPVKNLLECAGMSAEGLASDTTPLDILKFPDLNNLWLTNGSLSTDFRIMGSLVGAAVRGDCGPVNLAYGGSGGWDNHQGATGRVNEDKSMTDLGTAIGNVLKTANFYNKKVFVYVCTDGGLGASASNDPNNRLPGWETDHGEATVLWMLAFDPAGRPQTLGPQIGWFDSNQSSSVDHPVGNDHELAALSVFYNYLLFNQRKDLFESLIPQFGRLKDLVSDLNIRKQLESIAA